MRYRPLGRLGMSVSTVSLRLTDDPAGRRPSDWETLIYAALENGINAFDVVGRHASIAEGLASALASVERHLVFVAWRLGWSTAPDGSPVRDFSPDGMESAVEAVLERAGLEYLDAAVLDEPGADEVTPEALEALTAMRKAGRARMLGVSGHDDPVDAYISSGAFDLLCTQFSLISGWKERLRLKAAAERGMGVIGSGFYPEFFSGGPSPQGDASKAYANHPLAGAGTYAFLKETPRWTAEQLCMAYVLTEPALASVQVEADRPDHIEALAAVAERDLPAGVGAQFEMARFTPSALGDHLRKT